jgi:hypothetical protein
MEGATQGYARLLERFVAFAEAEEDISAGIVIGSRARSDHPADEWSDLDIVVLARHPGHYVLSTDWDDVWWALFATMELFRWLSVETATALGYPYPTEGADEATRLTGALRDQCSATEVIA